MEQTLEIKPKKLNGKIAIISLISFAVLMRVVGYFAVLVNWLLSQLEFTVDYVLNCLERGRDIDMSRLESMINSDIKHIKIPDVVLNISSMTVNTILTVVPFVLLIIYAAFLYKKSKATVIIPTAFGILTLRDIVSCIASICTILSIFLWSDEYHFASAAQQQSMVTWAVLVCIMAVLMSAPLLVLDLLLVIGSFRGFVNKALIIVPAIIQIAFQVLGALSAPFSVIIAIIGALGKINIVNSIFSLVGVGLCSTALVLFFIAVIILAAMNYIPEIIPMSDAKLEKLIGKKPKAALAILKTRYESGKISEEEYNSRIATIENK